MFKKLKNTAKKIRKEIKIYQLILVDKRTPKLAKIFLALAIGYLVCPIDLIPDFIPVIGQLDDILIVPFLVYIALTLIPKEIYKEYQQKLL